MTYEEMGAAAETLLGEARRLSGGDERTGVEILLLAAASITRRREDFIGVANHVFSELYGEPLQ